MQHSNVDVTFLHFSFMVRSRLKVNYMLHALTGTPSKRSKRAEYSARENITKFRLWGNSFFEGKSRFDIRPIGQNFFQLAL